MQIFLFKNKKKDEEKYPDYLIKDVESNLLGVCWVKHDKNDELYFSCTLNDKEEEYEVRT